MLHILVYLNIALYILYITFPRKKYMYFIDINSFIQNSLSYAASLQKKNKHQNSAEYVKNIYSENILSFIVHTELTKKTPNSEVS